MEVENAEGEGAEGTQRLETVAAGDMEEREKDRGWDAMVGTLTDASGGSCWRQLQ